MSSSALQVFANLLKGILSIVSIILIIKRVTKGKHFLALKEEILFFSLIYLENTGPAMKRIIQKISIIP